MQVILFILIVGALMCLMAGALAFAVAYGVDTIKRIFKRGIPIILILLMTLSCTSTKVVYSLKSKRQKMESRILPNNKILLTR